MSIVEVGKTQSRYVDVTFSLNKWRVASQEVASDEKLLSREYFLPSLDPSRDPRMSFEAVDFLPPGLYFVVRLPILVQQYLPRQPREGGRPTDSIFKYWREQVYAQSIAAYFQDLLVSKVIWTWEIDPLAVSSVGTNNPGIALNVLKTIEIRTRADVPGVKVDYPGTDLKLILGKLPGLRVASTLLEKAEISGVDILPTLNSNQPALLTGAEATFVRTDALGVIEFNFYGVFYQELVEFESVESNRVLGHIDTVPLLNQVYPPGVEVGDFFQDGDHLREEGNALYYRLDEPGQTLSSWADRSGAIAIG